MSRLALLWFVYSVTGSALKTSIIGLLQTLPPIVLGPLIGVTVDRLPKKAILIGSDVARALLIGVIPCALSVEFFTVEMLYLLVFLYGIATATFVPALSSSVPFLVDRPRFTAANALLQSTTSIGIIIGPALSGAGIAFSGSQDVLCVNAVTYLASALCLIPIRFPDAQSGTRTRMHWTTALLGDLTEGLRYSLFTQRTILILILLASLYTFGTGAFTTLFPVFGKKMLGVGPIEIGYIWSCLGIGLLVASLCLVFLTKWHIRMRVRTVAISSMIATAALWGLLWSRDLPVAMLLMGIIGIGFGTWTPIAWGLIQEIAPAEMVGRVMAIYTAIATATSMAGMTFFGWLTEQFDEYISVGGIGLVLFVLGVATLWFSGRVIVDPHQAETVNA